MTQRVRPDGEIPPLDSPLGEIHVQRLSAEHPIWSMLWFAYDTDDKHDWPRQRSHLLASKPIDGWRIVAEYHNFDGYNPERDYIETVDLVHVGIEPSGAFPWQIQRTQASYLDYTVIDPSDAVVMTEDGPEEQWSLAHHEVGVKPSGSLPAALLAQLGGGNLDEGADIVVEGSVAASQTPYLRGWYQLPRPLTSPTKRGRGARNVCVFAELAALYIHAAEVAPDAPVKWLHETFSYTRWPISRWHAVGNDLAKYGFIEGRRHGASGGSLTQRTLDELEAHRR